MLLCFYISDLPIHFIIVTSFSLVFISCSVYVNPYQKMILVLLWIQTTLNTFWIGFSDPGYILEGDDTDCENPIVCSIRFDAVWLIARCNLHIPPTARHCDDCNMYVTNPDHHCAVDELFLRLGFWIGKCVGEKNMSSFSSFCLSVVISFSYLIICHILSFFDVFSLSIFPVCFNPLSKHHITITK